MIDALGSLGYQGVLLAVIGAAMKLSLCVDPGRSWPEALALAQQADSAGWHAVYVCDHFMPHNPAGDPADGPMLECWTVLTALAALTARVRLGTLVLGNACRHPAVVANMAATLDQVSPGRLVLGLGAGWQANEYAAYGIALPALRDRVAILGEACAVIRSLLDSRRSTMNGEYYRLTDAPCDPKPVSRIGLLVGGGGLGVMRVAARQCAPDNLGRSCARNEAQLAEFATAALARLKALPGQDKVLLRRPGTEIHP